MKKKRPWEALLSIPSLLKIIVFAKVECLTYSKNYAKSPPSPQKDYISWYKK